MRESSQDVTVVTLLADPDAPTEIAQRMARMLPDRLAEKSGQGSRFKVVLHPDGQGNGHKK
ncbi:hypothetical protein M2163_003926 [Streptomyces sp. SAI-135]|uniref:hypothetical protein n=1 Tax=unclassified Streptomyces TaxID=2593676 RepID=UPI002473CDF3|nr:MULTISPECIES: hypothetical protein [unclassified Streptomyces]MDH6519088.1 hypothetical protein [Streptomyces sp. SAI-090]MDH6551309.1 hypothetical protein [Streptomyces sp. SAI-041]MDH6584641.1 hypothetical protein [Streptomyces sp. SAI-133]MDH6616818.1 hypothetical protein [Streptomyces sp. SAI-135]